MSGSCSATHERADAALIAAWLAARSIARGLPAPLAVPGGWRVDTDSAVEVRRDVFAHPSAEITRLARSIDRPGIYLKLCRDGAELAEMLPFGWQLDPGSWVMSGPDRAARATLPRGYVQRASWAGGVSAVHITTSDGRLAASGLAAEANGVFVYDRIITQRLHQRRWLGSATMALLDAARRDPASRSVLVATAAEERCTNGSAGRCTHPMLLRSGCRRRLDVTPQLLLVVE